MAGYLNFPPRLKEIKRDSFHQVDSIGAHFRMYPLSYYALVKAGLAEKAK